MNSLQRTLSIQSHFVPTRTTTITMAVTLPSRREVDILILGAGWTSTFLIPLLDRLSIPYKATTTTGRDNTIPFIFDPDSNDLKPYEALPRAKTILVTFPLKGEGQSKKIFQSYFRTHDGYESNWIQLGSTGIFQGDGWQRYDSPYDTTAPRAIAEDELIGLGGAVLNLAGLYGGTRNPKNWVRRVVKNKEQLKAKGAIHLVHGDDVAAAVVALHKRFVPGERFIVTDRHVYDWWDLIDGWGNELEEAYVLDKDETEKPPYRQWVAECMQEENVGALPRDIKLLGRVVDSRFFWDQMKTLPTHKLER